MYFFFFFQAEDGIRDTSVTGVQTCALPIYLRRRLGSQHARSRPQATCQARALDAEQDCRDRDAPARWGHRPRRDSAEHHQRSEERRVGKECRSRWWAGEAKNAKQKVLRR